MKKTYKNNIPCFQFHGLESFSNDVDHAIFSRLGGSSSAPYDSLNVSFDVGDNIEAVAENRNKVAGAFKCEADFLISAHQTHSKNVLVIDEEFLRFRSDSDDEIENVDAMITNVPEVALMIKVADCQAIILFDPVKRVIANIHAGWRGLAQNISGETIARMRDQFGVDPRNIRAGISPSLGVCCSFFSNPKKELPHFFEPFIQENFAVNLWDASVQQLENAGLLKEQIELARTCSSCGAGNKFFSFRRDHGVGGRFGVVAMLKS